MNRQSTVEVIRLREAREVLESKGLPHKCKGLLHEAGARCTSSGHPRVAVVVRAHFALAVTFGAPVVPGAASSSQMPHDPGMPL